MPAIDSLYVCVVTVTYGDRYELLTRMVDAAAKAGARRFVIVSNGVGATYRHKLESLSHRGTPKIDLVRLPQNTGSAEGFRRGIEAALKVSETQFLWLLDDDNTPNEDTLTALLARYRELSAEYATDRLALLSLRSDRPIFVRIAQGETPKHLIPPLDAIAGFDLGRVVSRCLRQLFRHLDSTCDRRRVDRGTERFVEIPYGPYSGLFLHRDLIRRVGVPDPRFVLYGDDTDFTSRIPKIGGKLFLVPESVIEDIEASWHITAGSRNIFGNLLRGEPDFRVFYSLRNGIYLANREKSTWVGQMINRRTFLACLWVLAVWHGRLDRYRLIRMALRDGINGKLGKKAGFDLP